MSRASYTAKAATLAILLSLAFAIFPLPSNALTVEEVPNPQQEYGGWVTDMADVLSDRTEMQLNQEIDALEAEKGTEIAVVTVPETTPAESPKQFATQLFNTWGIGKQEQDNGVLFLISVGDRRVEIETGYGIEPILPNAQVQTIIDRNIIPHFKQGDFDAGTLAGTTAIIGILNPEARNTNSGTQTLPLDAGRGIAAPVDVIVLSLLAFAIAATNYIAVRYIATIPAFVNPAPDQRLQGFKLFDFTLWFLAWLGTCGLIFLFASATFLFSGAFSSDDANGFFLGASAISPLVAIPLAGTFAQVLSTAGRERRSLRPLHCQVCQQPMVCLNASTLSELLTKPERAAEQVKSTDFEGWHCSHCFPKLERDRIHLRAWIARRHNFRKCPHCQEFIASVRSEILEPATYSHSGRKLTIEECRCCDYRQEKQVIIPKKQRSSITVSSSVGSGSKRRRSRKSSGGGRSGGGGAGGSW